MTNAEKWDACLTQLAAFPLTQQEPDIPPPTPAVVEQMQMLLTGIRHIAPDNPPTRLVPHLDGGLCAEWRVGRSLTAWSILNDGVVEFDRFDGPDLTEALLIEWGFKPVGEPA